MNKKIFNLVNILIKIVQTINNTFVVYFNPKRSVIINSSILIVSAATIEVCSQFIKD